MSASISGPVWVVGGGLAGCEIALQLAARDIDVRLFEMKPHRRTPAQVSDDLAELVCSNSFRGAALEQAVGAIKEEMRRAGGALIRFADAHRVPAGGALAVDRDEFSSAVSAAVRSSPNIELMPGEVIEVPSAEEASQVVIATGPLTTDALSRSIVERCGGQDRLYFYDAIAPIVAADSIDMNIAFRASRYGKGEGDDYLNLPLDEATYDRFVRALLEAEYAPTHDFEEARFFEGCLPIEVMASRGEQTLRFGCMKPVGLTDPRTGRWPYAVVQLRAENQARTAYNIVGFQTRMKWGSQRTVLRSLPGLGEAEFLRMGSIHRNTYIDSPSLLDEQLRLRSHPHLRFAGQITGVEGYVESMACGLLVSWMIVAERGGHRVPAPPPTSTLGALYNHVLGRDRSAAASKDAHVPSNVHWGMCPPLPHRVPKKEKKRRFGERAVQDLETWWASVRAQIGPPEPPGREAASTLETGARGAVSAS